MIQAKDISISVNETDPNGPLVATFTRTDTEEIIMIPVVLTLVDAKADQDTVTASIKAWLDNASGIGAINEGLKGLVL